MYVLVVVVCCCELLGMQTVISMFCLFRISGLTRNLNIGTLTV